MKLLLILALLFVGHASLRAADPQREFAEYLTSEQLLIARNIGDQDSRHPQPAALPDISGHGLSWVDWLKGHVYSFMAEPIIYRHRSEDDRKSIALVYGLFSLDRTPDSFEQKVPRGESGTKEVWKQFGHLFKTEQTQDLLVSWTVPNFKKAYESMSHEDRKIYDEIMAHAISYLKRFDLKKENAYLKKLRSEVRFPDNRFYDEGDFTSRDPNGFYSPYRKLECLIYRRIADGSFSKERLLVLATRIQKMTANWER